MRWIFTWGLSCVLALGLGCAKKTGPTQTKQAKQAEQTRQTDPGSKTDGQGKKRPDVAPRPAGPKQLWAVGGLRVPESVLYSSAGKVLYVSCINGKPTETNGLGFISTLSPEGKLLRLKWATGFDAPKGMGIHGDTLYVTDITRLHAVDTATGKIKQTVTAPDAKFLNDIAIGPRGTVYVSDMVRGTVHRLRDGKLQLLVNLKRFQGANGLLLQGEALLVGTATGIVKVTPATGAAELLVPVKGFGMIDGLRSFGPDAYVVSNWKGRTQLVTRAGKVTVLLDTTAQKIQSADLEYIPEKKLLLIPTFFDNRVVAYRVP